ncbi:MAG: hypothetical protein GY832_36490 [Chloroflexi bacterium]|nr:hypothetical protein [Chloroflexota bacterium]
MPPSTGPGAAVAGPQLGTALNPTAPAFQPLQLPSIAALIALQAQQGGAGPSNSGTAAARNASMNATTLPAALSPPTDSMAVEVEEGEIKEDGNSVDDSEAVTNKGATQKTTKKPLAFTAITCPSEGQI